MQPYVARRAALSTRLSHGVVVVPGAKEIFRNADSTYPFRFDSSFYYLTGFNEPDSVFVQVISAGKAQNILFC
ncbi:MAG: aminopeptidase P N-terminal domain-containing protein, partial [Iodobacter sp.]